jgi:MFS family permease
LNHEGEDCEDSLHLLQKSATIHRKQALTAAISQESNHSSPHGFHASVIQTLAAASKFGLYSRVLMNPLLYQFPFFTVMTNTTVVAAPASSVVAMSWYTYVLCGFIALNVLVLIAVTYKSCVVTDVPEEETSAEEGEDDDYHVAKFVGCMLAFVDANDWMVFTFFPTWCTSQGLSATDSGVIMSMMGIGLIIGAPFVQFMIPRLGGAAATLWVGNRVYLMTRVLCIGLIVVPKSILFPVACGVFLLTGIVWAVDEISAAAWVMTSVNTGEKRTAAIGYMSGGRLLGSLLGPGCGGLLYSLGGLFLPFFVGLVLLLCIQQYGRSLFTQYGGHGGQGAEDNFDAFSKGSILRHTPVLLTCICYTIVVSIYCSQLIWQQLYMLYHYHMATWEFGLMYTVLLVIMMIVMATTVAPADKFMGSIPASLLGFVTMASGYLIIGPSPLLPFLSTTQVWIPIIGSVLWGIGIAFPFVILYSFACNISIGAGWQDTEAAIQWATINILLTGAGLMIGPPLINFALMRLGEGSMCSMLAFILVCVCGGVLCLMSCLKYKDISRIPQPIKKPAQSSAR